MFLLRHSNDLSFMMPLISSLSKAKVVLYGGDYGEENIRLLNYYKIGHYYLEREFKYLLSLIGGLRRKLFWIQPIDVFLRAIFKSISNYQNRLYIRKLDQVLDNIDCFELDTFIFDHNQEEVSDLFINHIKNKFPNKKLKFIAAPHGSNFMENQMFHIFEIAPPKIANLNKYDVVVCDGEQDFKMLIGNKIIINSLRNTKFWMETLSKFQIKNGSLEERTKKIKILIFHSKFSGGINVKEFERTIKIINQFKNLELKIKPHPRGGIFELNKIVKNKERVSLFNGSLFDSLSWADYIINIQSGALIDSLIYGKPVLHPLFLTSNIQLDEMYAYQHVMRCADEVYITFKKISAGSYVHKAESFCPNDWQQNMDKWVQILK